ncbi:MGMT family protein [Virgibacillus necropolis]|uniref:DNA methyltransferase n=1 Tax=Virgibacillus necropolis TaxID=163877 RepID=A0A221M8F5_9BACI|nr:MGMT family protein [Virgibacillus necropolis]ASN03923.1 DNA methyltransferase [Virgibacillus necropolis]
MKPFTAKVVTILKDIPKGKVMTYGQVASVAGSPRGARQVVRILHSMSKKHELPWHRVVSIKGEIALKSNEGLMSQKSLLIAENIEVSESGQVNLTKYQHQPDFHLDEDG